MNDAKKRRRAKGDASYRKRPDGSWEGRIGIDGKPYSRYGKTRGEVKTKIELLVKEKLQGIVSSTDTLETWYEYWIENIIKPNRSGSTYEFYETLFRVHIIPKLGDKKLIKIKDSDIQDFINTKKTEVKIFVRTFRQKTPVRTEKPISATTVNHIANALRCCLNVAVTKRILPSNPAAGVEKPKIEQKTMETMSASDAKKLLESADSMMKEEPLFMAVLIAPYCGGRRGEILGMRRSQVILTGKHPYIIINKQLKKDSDSVKTLGDLKTEGSIRTVPIDKKVAEILKEYMKQQKKIVKYVDGKAVRVYPELLFCHEDGTAYHPDSYRHVVRRVMEKCGIDPLNPHALRHTYATILLESGASDRVIAELLGHASLAMLKKYAHVKNKLKAKAIEGLTNYIENS